MISIFERVYSSRRDIFFKFPRPRTNKTTGRYDDRKELQIIPNCPRFLLQTCLILETEEDRLSDLLPRVDYPSEPAIYDTDRLRRIDFVIWKIYVTGSIMAQYPRGGTLLVIFFSSGLRMFNQITVYWRYPWTPILADSRSWKINEGLLWNVVLLLVFFSTAFLLVISLLNCCRIDYSVFFFFKKFVDAYLVMKVHRIPFT